MKFYIVLGLVMTAFGEMNHLENTETWGGLILLVCFCYGFLNSLVGR